MEVELARLTSFLVKIWSEALNTRADPDTDFFDAGGDSLSAIMVINRVREVLGPDISLGLLFDYPTPSEFSAAVSSMRDVI